MPLCPLLQNSSKTTTLTSPPAPFGCSRKWAMPDKKWSPTYSNLPSPANGSSPPARCVLLASIF
jgi:hypothetical protein